MNSVYYRCMFTTLQFASVLQHRMDHISCPCSLTVCWVHVQEVLHINKPNISNHQTAAAEHKM